MSVTNFCNGEQLEATGYCGR